MRFEDQRIKLVEELYTQGIRDEAVLSAFAKIKREDFVLAEYREYAYRNRPLPINQSQTISQPYIIALMMSYLNLQVNDVVLEIGTGSGYQTALLASIVHEVCTVERLDQLSLSAQKILKKTGFRNIFFRIGDGWDGWQKAYPAYKEFSKIIVSAGADSIPHKLCDQLAEGGTLIIPVGNATQQVLQIVTREKGEIVVKKDAPCAFVPLIHDKKE